MIAEKPKPLPVTVERARAISRDALIFAKSKDWEYQVDPTNVNNSKIRGVPETWFLPGGLNPEILALICCPQCSNVLVLHSRIHKIDKHGRVSPDFNCNHCKLHRPLFLDEIHNKPLWACAIERISKRGDIKCEILYTCGADEAEARRGFGAALVGVRIVAIARAIGYFEDSTGIHAEAHKKVIS
jgi:uncharacterized protein YbaR (Trm112 family)